MPNKSKPIQEYTIQELVDLGFEVEVLEFTEKSRDYGHARLKQFGVSLCNVFQLSSGTVAVEGKAKGVHVKVFAQGEGGS